MKITVQIKLNSLLSYFLLYVTIEAFTLRYGNYLC